MTHKLLHDFLLLAIFLQTYKVLYIYNYVTYHTVWHSSVWQLCQCVKVHLQQWPGPRLGLLTFWKISNSRHNTTPMSSNCLFVQRVANHSYNINSPSIVPADTSCMSLIVSINQAWHEQHAFSVRFCPSGYSNKCATWRSRIDPNLYMPTMFTIDVCQKINNSWQQPCQECGLS